MKQFLTILFTVLTVVLYAQSPQTKPAPSQTKASSGSSDCFKEWYTLFKERGATEVADGTHEVIITIRYGTYTECYMGKVDVAGGKLAGKLLVQKVDGTFEELNKKVSGSFLNSEGALKEELRDVTNGMSETVTLADGESIRLFFFRSLASKPKANKKAPAPSALLK